MINPRSVSLVEIGEAGAPVSGTEVPAPGPAICAAYAELYRRVGFERPWVGYLAWDGDAFVGTCGFKGPPLAGEVQLAYHTLPEHEGRGYAAAMVRALIRIAQAHDDTVRITARTLMQEGSSTALLSKSGFVRRGTVEDPEDGQVWEWEYLDAGANVATG